MLPAKLLSAPQACSAAPARRPEVLQVIGDVVQCLGFVGMRLEEGTDPARHVDRVLDIHVSRVQCSPHLHSRQSICRAQTRRASGRVATPCVRPEPSQRKSPMPCSGRIRRSRSAPAALQSGCCGSREVVIEGDHAMHFSARQVEGVGEGGDRFRRNVAGGFLGCAENPVAVVTATESCRISCRGSPLPVLPATGRLRMPTAHPPSTCCR